MKVGDLIRYSKFPHEELHNSGLTGIVISDPYFEKPMSTSSNLHLVDIMWSEPRSPAWGNCHVTWEYVDELEILK